MCAIVDADSSGEIAAATASPAAQAFKEWIAGGRCCLVVGGTQLRKELGRGFSEPDNAKPTTVTEWVSQIAQAGRLVNHDDDEVDARAVQLRQLGRCASEDFHILALAQVSGARMLYSRDRKLHVDFTNPDLLDDPLGKVYPRSLTLARSKAWLARNRELCE